MLGANDGIVSVSSLIVGVAAADPTPSSVLIAGFAGLAAGAMSMAAGEYVSVSSQSDTEKADIARETQDIHAVVVPELNAGTASLIASAINPAVGLGSFLAQFLLRQPLQAADLLDASAPFLISPEALQRDFGRALAARPGRPEQFLLYFETGGAVLNAESRALLATIVQRARARVARRRG